MALRFLSKQWTLILFTLVIVLMIQIRYDLFSQYSSKYSNSPFCASSNEASKGNWIVKTDLTRYEIEERKRLDVEIRKSMNWPANMFRNDSRYNFCLSEKFILCHCRNSNLLIHFSHKLFLAN